MTGERVDIFDPDVHFSILKLFEVTPRGGGLPVLLAAPPGSRYPYVYPRDLAGAARVLGWAVERGFHAGESLRYLEGAALFLLECQAESGEWRQRYELDFRDASIYYQEDNPAHGVSVIARYLRAARRLGRDPEREAELLNAMRRGFEYSVTANFRPKMGLFESTTTIHESAIESGFTLWNNCAHLEAARALEKEIAVRDEADSFLPRLHEFHRLLADAIRERLVKDGNLLRRRTRSGKRDYRPDVTLASPYYFDVMDVHPRAFEASLERAERDLWDRELGLLHRYPPDMSDPDVHVHAGAGPWLAYSAMFAQARAHMGDTKRALELLDQVANHATGEGYLPEHLTTRERFEEFWRELWERGEDFRREFAPHLLLPGVTFPTILEESVRMGQEYARIRERLQTTGSQVFRFTRPLMWSHAEFLGALFALGAPENPVAGARTARQPRNA